jgi:hypothetical protein
MGRWGRRLGRRRRRSCLGCEEGARRLGRVWKSIVVWVKDAERF